MTHEQKQESGDTGMRTVHALKCERKYFVEVKGRRKTAEVRLDDRGFCVGDLVELHPMQDGKCVGPSIIREITHILTSDEGPWLSPGYVMLSFGEAP